MSKWDPAYKLILNLDETNAIKFITNNLPHCELSIGCKEKYIEGTVNADISVDKLVTS
jgi:hypothetical protein